MNKGVVYGTVGGLAIATLLLVASAEETPMGDVDVDLYRVGASEWGYTLTRRDTFIHAERGLPTQLAAQEAARAYIKDNLGVNP